MRVSTLISLLNNEINTDMQAIKIFSLKQTIQPILSLQIIIKFLTQSIY
jgi:hypothetical protein